MRLGEIVRRGVDVAAVELILVGKRDGVDDEIERAPCAASAANAASMVAGSVTSQWPTTSAPISCASGSTRFLNASP